MVQPALGPRPSGEALERPDLDLAAARLGALGGELQRHVEVGGVDDPETPDDLLGLEVGAVGQHRRTALAVDDGFMPAFNQLAIYYLERARACVLAA